MTVDTEDPMELPEITITGITDEASVISILVSDDVAYPAMDVNPADYPRMIYALRTLANALEDDSPVLH